MAEFQRWVYRLIVRSLWQNKLRTILTILGVMLGVGILLAINLANDMALSNFKDSIDRVSGKSNLTIRPTQSDAFDERLLNNLRWIWLLPGEERSGFNPGIEQTALWPEPASPPPKPAGEPLSNEVVQVLGMDMLGTFRDTQSGMQLIAKTRQPLDILKPYHAYVGERLAKIHHLQPGSPFNLYLNDRLARFTVAGILSESGLGNAYGGSLAVMDLSTAQEAFRMNGKLSKIDLIVPESLLSAVQAKLEQQLPNGLAVQRPAQRSAQVEKMIRSYQYNLTTLSFIALLVGVFLIYNTMSITIIRRRPEIGTLRAIGFAKHQIFGLFVIEAFIIGLIGTLLGIGFGVFLSQYAAKAVATTVANLYTGQVLDMFSVNPWMILQAFGFGIVMTLIGALAPVLEATSIAPAEASRRASYESRIVQQSGKLSLIGSGLAVVALISSSLPPVSGLPVFGFVSAFTTILAAALWMPLLVKISLTNLLPLLKAWFKTEGRLAGLILRGALGRTAVAVASLMIGIAMMVSLAVMISSFRQTVVSWVQQTLKADLWIEPASKFGSKQTGRIAPQAVAAIRGLPGVEAVDAFYEFPIEFRGNPTHLGVGDFEVLAKHGKLLFMNGESAEQVLKRVRSRPSVTVTEAFATRNNVKQNDIITLNTPTGLQRFRVEAVYYDYSSDLGYIVMPRQWYREFYKDDRISNLAVYLKPHVSSDTIRTEIQTRLKGQSLLHIRSNRELREEVLRIFDRTFAITYALHVIAIAVALLAVMNSLFALVLEARREFGILKYLGAEDRQIGKIVMIKAGLLGFFGNVSGLAVGFLLSYLLIYVINKQSFGWTIRFELPLAFLIQSFLLVMATSILSGLIPARLAAKTLAPEVIKSE